MILIDQLFARCLRFLERRMGRCEVPPVTMNLKAQIKCYDKDGLIEAVGFVREDGSVVFYGAACRVAEAIKSALQDGVIKSHLRECDQQEGPRTSL